MRKLVYEINNTLTVNTYKEAQEAKDMGYTVKEKLVDIPEKYTGRRLTEKVIADRKKKRIAAALN